MAACPSDPTFNIAETAGLYAQTAGVLAGFAFSALVLISRQKDGERRVGGLALTMIAAFVSLILSSLMYSVLAGEHAARGRAATEQLVNGLPFSMSVIMVFYGVSLLLGANQALEQVAVRVSQVLTAIAAPTISMFYLVAAALDVETARVAVRRMERPGFCGSLEPIGTIGLILVPALLLALVVVWATRPTHRLRRAARDLRNAAPTAAVSASILSTVLAGLASMQQPEYVPPVWAVIAFLIIGWMLLIAIAALIIWGAFTGRPPASNTSDGGNVE